MLFRQLSSFDDWKNLKLLLQGKLKRGAENMKLVLDIASICVVICVCLFRPYVGPIKAHLFTNRRNITIPLSPALSHPRVRRLGPCWGGSLLGIVTKWLGDASRASCHTLSFFQFFPNPFNIFFFCFAFHSSSAKSILSILQVSSCCTWRMAPTFQLPARQPPPY